MKPIVQNNSNDVLQWLKSFDRNKQQPQIAINLPPKDSTKNLQEFDRFLTSLQSKKSSVLLESQ